MVERQGGNKGEKEREVGLEGGRARERERERDRERERGRGRKERK